MQDALGRCLVDGARSAEEALGGFRGIASGNRFTETSYVSTDPGADRRVAGLTFDALSMTLLRGWMLVHSGAASSSAPGHRQ